MEKIITYETLRNFAYSNDRDIQGEIKGIVLTFFGLGGTMMFNDDLEEARVFTEHGIIYVLPYYNPWSWMNRQAVRYVDEIIEVLCEKYAIDPKTVKIASTGPSMGGLCAIVYSAYARITPCACIANCPVCDLPYHFTERPDLPRTLYSAFGEYEESLEDAMKTASPVHITDRLPDIPYTLFHCDADQAVNMEKHALPFVAEMEKSHRISFTVVPGRGHCDLGEMGGHYVQAILKSILSE